MPASRTALAEVRLTVPGKYDKELLGLYTVVEEVGKPFLRDQFGTDKGLLMKPERLRDFEDRGDDWDGVQEGVRPEARRHGRRGGPRDRIRPAGRTRPTTPPSRRRSSPTWTSTTTSGSWRVTAFVANTDSFFVLGHNYYIYLHPKTNRLHFIPWDLDRAFANFPILGSNNQKMDLSLDPPLRRHAPADRATPRRAGRRRAYQKLLKELAATCFEKQRLLQRLAAVESATKELVERDAKAAAARKDGGSGFGPPGMFGKPPALKEFIEKRTASVAAQVAGTSKGYVPTGGPGGGGPPQVGAMLAGPMLAALDTDRDEKLSRDEWLAAAKEAIRRLREGRGRAGRSEVAHGRAQQPVPTAAPGHSAGLQHRRLPGRVRS